MKLWMMAVMMAGAMTAMAQKPAIDEVYLTVDEVPNAVYWLPVPPEPGSTQFVHDINQYYWGKEQRLDSARAQKAIREADHKVKDMVRHFSPAFGMEISEEKTPAIYKVVNRSVLTIRLSASKPKNTYMRKRPYARFNEPSLVPGDEEDLRHNGSYPSGHTMLGWSSALVLMEINPAAQDELLARGYSYGESRVIAGFHWQSDVNAAMLAASAAVARLHTSDRFQDQMKKAKAEFAKKKK